MSLLDWDTALWIPLIPCESLRQRVFEPEQEKLISQGETRYCWMYKLCNLPQCFIHRKCHAWGKRMGTHHVYMSNPTCLDLQTDKTWKGSTQFLMGLHLDAVAMRRHDLEYSLLLRHTPEWRDNWEEQPQWRTTSCSLLQWLKLHADTQRLQNKNIHFKAIFICTYAKQPKKSIITALIQIFLINT